MLQAHRPTAETLAWVQRLVRHSTISHQSNLALIEDVADHLRGLGVPIRLTYDDQRGKANLFATLGAGKPDGVILSGHTDTVPWEGQAWTTDPLGAELRGDRLYGRGSADMKGFIGVAVSRARSLLEADLPFAVHFAFSYDEEVGGFGVRHLIADLRDAGLAPRLCFVGEPTGMVPATAHKGVHRWRCHVKGKPAHSSLTPMAVNAIEAGARLIAHLADLADRLRDEGPRREGFDVPWSTAATCVVQGGSADNIVAEDCRFHYEFRNLPGTDEAAMQQSMLDRAARIEAAMKAVDAGCGIRFEAFATMPAFEVDPADPVVRIAARLAGSERTSLVAFGTEAGMFERAGIRTVICGPGHIAQAHQPDEFVSLAQLAACEHFVGAIAGQRGAIADALAR